MRPTIGMMLLALIGCKQLEQLAQNGPKKMEASQPLPASKEEENVDEDKPLFPAPPAPPEVVEARLSGYPDTKSPNHTFDIGVSGVKEYRWKYGTSSISCDSDGGYSNYIPATTPIKLDLSDIPDVAAIVILCVKGRSEGGAEQKNYTRISWVFAPEIPTLADQVEITEGDNEVTIKPINNLTGNWIIVRSKDPLTTQPTAGKMLSTNDALGNGTVLFSGAVGSYTDKTVKNGESWFYHMYLVSPSKRYSNSLTKSMLVSVPELQWVARDNVMTGMMPLAPRGGNDTRYVCRSRMNVNGENRGVHPGLFTSANNDLKNGICRFEYGGAIFQSSNYELLLSTKGNPNNLITWVRSTSNGTTTTIPARAIISGRDDVGAMVGENLYVCRGYTNANRTTVASFGKAGPNLGQGCLYYNGVNSTATVNGIFDILTLRASP